MSGHESSAPHDASHGGHDEHGSNAFAHVTVRDYLIGFGLSVILTAVPFWLVMGEVFENKQLTALIIMAFAIVQIVVHVVYFLHMTSSSEEGWSLLSLIFTLVVIVIALAGSLWVMHHLTTNTMPYHDMRQIP